MSTGLPNSVLVARRQWHRAIRNVPRLAEFDANTSPRASAARSREVQAIWSTSAAYAHALRQFAKHARRDASADITLLRLETLLANLTLDLLTTLDHDHLREQFAVSKNLLIWVPAAQKEKHAAADTAFRELDGQRISKLPRWLNSLARLVLHDDNSRNVILSARRGALMPERVMLAHECGIAAWLNAAEFVENESRRAQES